MNVCYLGIRKIYVQRKMEEKRSHGKDTISVDRTILA